MIDAETAPTGRRMTRRSPSVLATVWLAALVVGGCGQERDEVAASAAKTPRATPTATPRVAPAPRSCLRDLNREYADRNYGQIAWPTGYRRVYATRRNGHCVVVLDPRAAAYCGFPEGVMGKIRDDRTYWLNLGPSGLADGGNELIDRDLERATAILTRLGRLAQRSPNARVTGADGRIAALPT